jgi:hypothetical protein
VSQEIRLTQREIEAILEANKHITDDDPVIYIVVLQFLKRKIQEARI